MANREGSRKPFVLLSKPQPPEMISEWMWTSTEQPIELLFIAAAAVIAAAACFGMTGMSSVCGVSPQGA